MPMTRFRSMAFLVALCLGALTLVSATPSQAEFRLGIQGGLNSSKFSGDTPSNTKYTSRSGLMYGVVGDFRLSDDAWLSIQPMVQQRGTNSEVSENSATEPVPGRSVETDYFALPVLVRIYADNKKVYVLGGFNVGFLTKAELVDPDGTRQDVESYLTSTDLAMDFGFGGMFPVRGALLNVELRYEQGLLNQSNNNEDPEETGIPTRLRQSGFQFLAGIQWPLGGK
jgi:hypothetical protein